jgi:4-amino-4-deoxy-L-arabinose transferase-like glycosyltransferase
MSLDHPHPDPITPGILRDQHVRGGGTLASIPPFIWLATFTLLALALLGTLVLPQLRIPDEKHHADMVLMVQEGEWLEEGWPGLGERRIDPSIIAASLSLGRREQALRENRAGQHPPLFYLTAAATSSLATFAVEGPDLAVRLWTYRLVSVVVTALLPLIFYLVASELTTNQWVRLASAVLPLSIPGITLRDGAMINTDALLMLLTSISVLMSIRVAKDDLSLRTAIFLGMATGLACLTKGHALLVIPVLIVAYSISAIRRRRVTRQWLHSVMVSGGITLTLGGWWWIRNLVLYGAIQPVRDLEPAGGPPAFVFFDWLAEATRRLVASFWGGGFALGGRNYMPLFVILTVLFVVACVAGWLKSQDRSASSVSGLYAIILMATVLLASASLSSKRGRVVGVQGRYFFPGLAGLAPLVALALAAFVRRANRWLPAFLVAGSLAMTLLAIDFMLDRYWSSFGSRLVDQWSGVVASSPLVGTISTGILVLSAASFLTLLVASILLGTRNEASNTSQAAEVSLAAIGSLESENSA